MINNWKNFHPSAANNQAHQAEVVQFKHHNIRVVNIRSLFQIIHTSTNLATKRTANNGHRVQTNAIR